MAGGAEAPAMSAAQNMDVGTAARAFKKAGDENFFSVQNDAADRAYPVAISAKAEDAAFYVHEPVFAAVYGRVGYGAYKFPLREFGRTYGADLGFSRHTCSPGSEAVFPGQASPGGNTHADEEGITEPE